MRGRAKREGWLGEVEGLQVSLAGAKDKLAQLDNLTARRSTAVHLGVPTLTLYRGRTRTAVVTCTFAGQGGTA